MTISLAIGRAHPAIWFGTLVLACLCPAVDAQSLSIADLPNEVQFDPQTETQIRRLPLWNTTLVFVLLCSLMLGEWLFRKLNNMP